MDAAEDMVEIEIPLDIGRKIAEGAARRGETEAEYIEYMLDEYEARRSQRAE